MDQIGRIQIECEIGRGGMGVVCKGYDSFLHRHVAVKSVIASSDASDKTAEASLKRLDVEARAAARLSHANIVTVHDVIPAANSFYVVMEFIEGRSLDALAPEGSRQPLPFVARLIRECASALDHAHARGVIHRDIKPSNIMVDQAGAAKIADFGIAKLTDSTARLTQGHAIGTLAYMSPEQMMGATVDGRSDQYSLAVVAYRLLTGIRQRSVPASAVNRGVRKIADDVLNGALEAIPAARYPSCSQFAQELSDALAVSESAMEAQTVVIEPVPSKGQEAQNRSATGEPASPEASAPPYVGVMGGALVA